MPSNPTAAILIIGNEILSGRTHDLNGPYLIHQLFQQGIDVKEIRIIPDCHEAIIKAIHDLKLCYSFVFTTGGIGPTHDDVTASAMAQAFGVELYSDPEAVRRLQERYPNPKAPEALMRMSYIPQGAKLIDNPLTAAPGFHIENVYVMAGIPVIMQAMFATLHLQGGTPKKEIVITCAVAEGVIAKDLKTIQEQHPTIDIGSYPHWSPNSYNLSITAKGIEDTELKHVQEKLITLFEKHDLAYTLQKAE